GGQPLGDGPPCHRQHGGRTRCHDHGVPLGRRGPRVPAWGGTGTGLRGDGPGRERHLRRHRRDRPLVRGTVDRETLLAGNVVPRREVAGTETSQVVIGSSANPGLRDFAIAGAMVQGRQTNEAVSFDVNPTSRQILTDLTKMGSTVDLIAAGARIHQTGCMGCIGMGQAPAVGQNSLRTFPRNFPGRSGTKEDSVWLCSPETAAASALTGVITDPRDLAEKFDMTYPEL